MPNYTDQEVKFLNLIYAARKVSFDINKIVKRDLKKQEEKRKILIAINKAIFDTEIVEAGIISYRRNKIIRYIVKYFIKYYIKSFESSSKPTMDDTDEDMESIMKHI